MVVEYFKKACDDIFSTILYLETSWYQVISMNNQPVMGYPTLSEYLPIES